jgi:hypothetical protein
MMEAFHILCDLKGAECTKNGAAFGNARVQTKTSRQLKAGSLQIKTGKKIDNYVFTIME